MVSKESRTPEDLLIMVDGGKVVNVKKPIENSQELRNVRAWKQDRGSGIIGIVTTRKCLSSPVWKNNIATEIGDTFEFESYTMIPSNRLHRKADAWYLRDDGYAVTVIGCWSASAHKIFFFRKVDRKKWEQERFFIDENWEEIDLN